MYVRVEQRRIQVSRVRQDYDEIETNYAEREEREKRGIRGKRKRGRKGSERVEIRVNRKPAIRLIVVCSTLAPALISIAIPDKLPKSRTTSKYSE